MNIRRIVTHDQVRNSHGPETITARFAVAAKRITAESVVAMTGVFHGPISSLQSRASCWLDLHNAAHDSRIIAEAQARLETRRRALGIYPKLPSR